MGEGGGEEGGSFLCKSVFLTKTSLHFLLFWAALSHSPESFAFSPFLEHAHT